MVSEPPEEEEQEKECEDVGVAFFRIPDILEQQQDLIETSLNSEYCVYILCRKLCLYVNLCNRK